jgi:hypothetical protein
MSHPESLGPADRTAELTALVAFGDMPKCVWKCAIR